jgi:predicted nucleic acid-binding protein
MLRAAAAMEIPTTDDADVLQRACALAIDLQQHVFDTLYHAVALQSEDTQLITADDRYYNSALGQGGIRALRAWGLP